MKTVWVVFDPLYERIMSVHETEISADKRCGNLNDQHNRWNTAYLYENDEFKIED